MSAFLHWLHVIAAVVLVGGVYCLRFILYPAFRKVLEKEPFAETERDMLRRFGKTMAVCAIVLVATGIHAYWVQHAETDANYRAILVIKIIFGLSVIYNVLMIPLTANSGGWHHQRRWSILKWQTIFGFLVLGLAAYLRSKSYL